MKSIIKTFSLALVLISLMGCNDSFLERFPSDQVTDDNFWQTEDHLKSVANTFTASLRGKDWMNLTEIMADLAPWAVTTAYRTIGGGKYATDLSNLNSIWVTPYRNIGRINYFLENYQRATSVSEEVKKRYAAEAYFYRAYNYWVLTSYFGDVPYIDTVLSVESPDVTRARDPRATVINTITTELEAHYLDLPEYIPAASSEFGRVSQVAALALLSRIYLHNGLWAEAANAAERAMSNSYYRLYSTGNPSQDYCNLFNYTGRASRNGDNHEVILAFVYNYELGEDSRTSHNLSREIWVPNDYSRFVPTKTAIEQYLSADGSIWDPASASTYEDVFVNRDPRMVQSILAPGTPWEGAPSGADDTQNTDNHIFTYPKLANTRTGCMTYTGYYLRKYVEPSTVGTVSHDDNDIVLFRYAEILLNYAEAKERLNTLTQADLDRTINLLRDRVGMVHMNLSSLPATSNIREEIKRERSVELFFEGHRYFDIIRWGEGYRLGEDLVGVNRRWIDPSRISVDLSTLNWKTIGSQQYLLLETDRTYSSPKNDLLSIPFTQTQLNPNLLPNNPGWE